MSYDSRPDELIRAAVEYVDVHYREGINPSAPIEFLELARALKQARSVDGAGFAANVGKTLERNKDE